MEKINYENAQSLKLTVKNVSLSDIIFYNEIKILSNVSGYTKKESSIIAILKSLKGKNRDKVSYFHRNMQILQIKSMIKALNIFVLIKNTLSSEASLI